MSKESLSIEGMTCQSCVIRVTRAILSVPGVSGVNVNLAKQSATFNLDPSRASIEKVVDVVNDIGYSARKERSFDWFYLWGFIIIFGIFMISKMMMKYIPGIEQGTNYSLIFLTGVLTSFHCLGMCGGITLSQVSNGNTFLMRSINLLEYHLGRVFSYTSVGAILGAIGSIATPTDKLRGLITLVAALGMIIFALKGLLPQWFGRIRLGGVDFARHRLKGKFGQNSWWVGVLNGFIPCGPLQGIQLLSLASGSAVSGGLSMLLFSLGTVPLLYGFGNVANFLSATTRIRLVKLGLIFVVLLAFMMISKGIAFLNL